MTSQLNSLGCISELYAVMQWAVSFLRLDKLHPSAKKDDAVYYMIVTDQP